MRYAGKKKRGEEKMKATFDSLTKRIKQAEDAREKSKTRYGKMYWNGYIRGLKDLRDNINSKD
ncbi:hypothetical protein ES703_06881 [subsurface metagenome]